MHIVFFFFQSPKNLQESQPYPMISVFFLPLQWFGRILVFASSVVAWKGRRAIAKLDVFGMSSRMCAHRFLSG